MAIFPGKNQAPNPYLRKPPAKGGPRRISPPSALRMGRQKSWLKKAAPYLIAGGTTGAGLSLGFLIT